MPVSYVASVRAATPLTDTNTSLSVGKPTGTAVDDVVVLWLVIKSATVPSGITGPSGFTAISGSPFFESGTPNCTGVCWVRLVDGTEGATFATSWTGVGNAQLVSATYRGVNFAAITSNMAGQAASSTSRPSPTLTTTVAGWIVTGWGDRNGSTWTHPDTVRETGALSSAASVLLGDSNADVAAGTINRTATASATTSVGVTFILLLPAGAAAFSGSLGLSGSGSLSFASIPTPNGDLALSGSGTLDFSSVPALLSSLALAGSGSLAFTAGLFVPGTLGLSGEGTLSFSAAFAGSLSLSGSGALSLVGIPFVSSVLALSGGGSLTLQSQPFIPAPLGLSGAGTLSFAALPNEVGVLVLSGGGALSFVGSPAVLGAVNYEGSGTLAGGSGMTLVPLASIATATGWTATGGTVLAVLGDSSDSTLITSSDDPSNVLFDGTFGAITPPSGAFTVRVRTYKSSAASGTLIGKLYVNTTLKSTVSVSIPDVLGNVYLVFPAGDLATITAPDWAAGVRITLAATAT